MNKSEIILDLEKVGKSFKTPNGNLEILKNITCQIKQGEKVAIIGPSGSGKSTLLSLIGLLDSPTHGTIKIAGVSTSNLDENKKAIFRNKNIGFIFQSFELISPFTVEENISAPLEIGGLPTDELKLSQMLKNLGITNRREALPQTLSGGEKQRVAIGRALFNNPELILADEPTGSLDRHTGERVLSMLLEAVENSGKTLLIITHDESIASRMDRVFELKDKSLHERN